MKLYTENQVKEIIALCYLRQLKNISINIEDVQEQFTPIELPSDEEIENYIEKTFYGEKKYYFKAGVEFMKEQILNQNNNNERVTTDNDRVY